MGRAGKTGVSAETPKNTLLGAGTIHKNLKYSAGSGWNLEDSIIGATNGGNKLTITPEYYDIPVDGVGVAVKGMKVKIGETATLEINFAEVNDDIMQAGALGKAGASDDSGYRVIVPRTKELIEDGAYYDNIAYVGTMLDGRHLIAILENAFCTSGLALDAKNKDAAAGAYTFACHADMDDLKSPNTLPWKIYVQETASAAEVTSYE